MRTGEGLGDGFGGDVGGRMWGDQSRDPNGFSFRRGTSPLEVSIQEPKGFPFRRGTSPLDGELVLQTGKPIYSQAIGSWAYALWLRHQTTSNPGTQDIGSWA